MWTKFFSAKSLVPRCNSQAYCKGKNQYLIAPLYQWFCSSQLTNEPGSYIFEACDYVFVVSSIDGLLQFPVYKREQILFELRQTRGVGGEGLRKLFQDQSQLKHFLCHHCWNLKKPTNIIFKRCCFPVEDYIQFFGHFTALSIVASLSNNLMTLWVK